MTGTSQDSVEIIVNGETVVVADTTATLLEVLRGQAGMVSVKDGCSPQGQCGCCTVLVDGQPRVSCVTPIRRVPGREVTTVEGLAPEQIRTLLGDDFAAKQQEQLQTLRAQLAAATQAQRNAEAERDQNSARLTELTANANNANLIGYNKSGSQANGITRLAEAAAARNAQAREAELE